MRLPFKKIFNEKVLFLVSIIFSIFLVFLIIPDKPFPLQQDIDENNQPYVILNPEYLFDANNILDNINRAFGVPFDLNFFKFCAKDNTTTSKDKFGVISSKNNSVFVSIEVNNRLENITSSYGSEACSKKIYVDSSSRFNLLNGSGSVRLGFTINLSNMPVSRPDTCQRSYVTSTYNINYEYYARQVSTNLWIKRLFLFFVILALLDLVFNSFNRIFKKK